MVMEPQQPPTGTSVLPATPVNNSMPANNNNVETAPFNPQSLGREFVRQYYTVLNQGPHILHR